MEKLVIYSFIGLFSGYVIFDRIDSKSNESRLNNLTARSKSIDSLVKDYEVKIDSLYKTNDSLFGKVDSQFIFVDGSIDSIEVKTNIELDSSDVNEALLWADSVSQYY